MVESNVLLDCEVCDNLRVIPEEDGTMRPCECQIRHLVKQELSEFIPAPHPVDRTNKMLSEMMVFGPASIYIPRIPKDQDRTLFLMYLTRRIFMRGSFKILNSYDIVRDHFGDEVFLDSEQDLTLIQFGKTPYENKWEPKVVLHLACQLAKRSQVILYDHASDAVMREACMASGFVQLRVG